MRITSKRLISSYLSSLPSPYLMPGGPLLIHIKAVRVVVPWGDRRPTDCACIPNARNHVVDGTNTVRLGPLQAVFQQILERRTGLLRLLLLSLVPRHRRPLAIPAGKARVRLRSVLTVLFCRLVSQYVLDRHQANELAFTCNKDDTRAHSPEEL